MLDAGSSTRGSLHCMHRCARSPGVWHRRRRLGPGWWHCVEARPVTWPSWPSTACSPILMKMGRWLVTNISVKGIPICCGSPKTTCPLLPQGGSFSIRHCDSARCQKHSSIASRPPWLGARRKGISPLFQKFEHRALSLRPKSRKRCLGPGRLIMRALCLSPSVWSASREVR